MEDHVLSEGSHSVWDYTRCVELMEILVKVRMGLILVKVLVEILDCRERACGVNYREGEFGRGQFMKSLSTPVLQEGHLEVVRGVDRVQLPDQISLN